MSEPARDVERMRTYEERESRGKGKIDIIYIKIDIIYIYINIIRTSKKRRKKVQVKEVKKKVKEKVKEKVHSQCAPTLMPKHHQ